MNDNTENNLPSLEVADQSNMNLGTLMMNPKHMAAVMQFADFMAKGVSTVPKHLKGNPSDCMAVCLQAMQWGMLPHLVAQKTHLVHGVLGYEAQLVNAVINSMAPTTGRLEFEWFGPWDQVIGKFRIVKGKEGKSDYHAPDWNTADEAGCGVKVWATIKGEDNPRVLELLLSQATVRNSTLWASDPKQQLAYLAIKKWSRLYTPDVIMGVYTPDELNTVDADSITPDPKRDIPGEADTLPEEDALPEYPEAKFAKNIKLWKRSIECGGSSAKRTIDTVGTKFSLSESQLEAINACKFVEPEPDPEDQQENATARDSEGYAKK